MIRGVRGATTVEHDTPEEHEREVLRLIQSVIAENDIQPDDVATLFFTITEDLRAVSPAKIVRTLLPHWSLVPMVCAREPDIEGLPSRCIRVLVQFETIRPQSDIKHVYLNRAVTLRPDLQSPAS